MDDSLAKILSFGSELVIGNTEELIDTLAETEELFADDSLGNTEELIDTLVETEELFADDSFANETSVTRALETGLKLVTSLIGACDPVYCVLLETDRKDDADA